MRKVNIRKGNISQVLELSFKFFFFFNFGIVSHLQNNDKVTLENFQITYTQFLLSTFSVQFSYPMNRCMPGLPVHHQLPEFTQTHVHRVSDAIHPSHPLSSPSPPAPNPSQQQSLFQRVNSLHKVAKVLEFQL